MNCWEFKFCGLEEGGINVKEGLPCPACPGHGTRCAEAVGTLSGKKPRGFFAGKLGDCTKCYFYNSEYYQGRRMVWRKAG